MKHRALSMLLALLMVVSLLPIAAIAGDEEANFTMRLQGGDYNASYSLFADTYVGVRFEAYDESEDATRPLSGNDTLTCDGKVVTSVVYDSDNTWRVTIAEPESGEQSGWIEYSGKRISIDLRLKHGEKVESFVGKTADEELATQFVWNDQTYYLGVSDGEDVRPFGSGSCELQSEDKPNGFMFKAQVFTLDNENKYVRVNNDVRAEIDKNYDIFVKVWPTESCVGYYYPLKETLKDGSLNCQFTTASLGTWLIEVTAIPDGAERGFTHYSQLTVSYRETQEDGALGMSYDGSGFVKSYELFAGTHRNIEFKVGNKPLNFSAISEAAPADEKLTYGGLVKQLDFEGRGIWAITLDEPTDNETIGWIQYGTDKSNRVTITVKPSHGGAVDKDDPETKIYEQGSVEFIEAERGVVTPFKWHDETYYLGTAAWSTKKPYALGGRGVNEAEDFYTACVFSLKSGEAGSSDATYELREDIRKKMMDEGYQFELTLVPTDIGCNYRPITRTVDMTLEQQGDGGTVEFTSKWQGQKFSKASVGLWVYDACIFDSNDELFKENLSSCKYSYTVNDTVELEGSIEKINETIAAVLQEKDAELGNTEMEKNGLYNGEVTFILPKGTITGEIVIPDTNCIVTVYGNDYGQGRIATTLEGGIRFDNDNTNHVGFIHFVGKGKDGNGNYVKWADERNQIPNEAVYGVGQGAPEVCIFEGYDIAIHSTKRPSWGSQDSIYLNNNVAICQNSDNGGQTIMRNNWFIGNNIAVMLKESVPVDYLMNYRNRFINNTIDFGNESYKVLWVSENFFYHGSWNPTETDLWRVENGKICPIFNGEDLLIVPGAPFYTKTENYKDDYNAYKEFLPRFGGFSQTYAYPIATSQFCNEMFYPNRRDPSYCPQWWSADDPYYPSYVRQGSKISTYELDGSRFSSYDSETDTAVGTFEFGASAAEAEN